jgi:hypothetical protein
LPYFLLAKEDVQKIMVVECVLSTTGVVHCSLAVAYLKERIRSEEEEEKESILVMGKSVQEDSYGVTDRSAT